MLACEVNVSVPTVFISLVLVPVFAVGAWGQQQPESAGTQQRRPGSTAEAPLDRATVEMQKRMAKERQKERFAELKKDTDRLLELATQLKKSVDEANDQTLSLEVIRKAEQIEKLAKHVREKMVGN